MIDIQTTNITIILLVFYDYHYHHRYHYSYHNFIITILCYAPSVITCTVAGAIQMTVYIYIYITGRKILANDLLFLCASMNWNLYYLLLGKSKMTAGFLKLPAINGNISFIHF